MLYNDVLLDYVSKTGFFLVLEDTRKMKET